MELDDAALTELRLELSLPSKLVHVDDQVKADDPVPDLDPLLAMRRPREAHGEPGEAGIPQSAANSACIGSP